MHDSSIHVDPRIAIDPQEFPNNGVGALPVAPHVEPGQQAVHDATRRTRILAATIELICHLDRSTALVDAAEHAAGALCEHVGASHVVVLWRRSDRSGMKILARHEAVDHRLPTRHWDRLLIAAAEEVGVREIATAWPAPSGQSHSLLAVKQLVDAASVQQIAGVPLNDIDGKTRGSLLVIDHRSDATELLHVLGPALGSKLSGLEQLEPTVVESKLRDVVGLLRSNKKKGIIAAAMAVAFLLLLPVRYRIATDLELQPVMQRFVAVPFDAPLKRAHVRPGDVVQQGDLLATINPREIEFELAGTRAELNRALQEKKGFLAEHDFAGSKIAALDSEKLQLKADLLEYQRTNLEIRSPISGLVVSGDLAKSEGMPMSRGETVMEIAPLGQVGVELAVPESDFAHVRPGMPVSFYVHAFPGQRIEGTVERIHPRAELRDQAPPHVFVRLFRRLCRPLAERVDAHQQDGQHRKAGQEGDDQERVLHCVVSFRPSEARSLARPRQKARAGR